MSIIKEILYRIRGEYTTEKLISMGMKVGKNFGRLHGVNFRSISLLDD